MATETFWWPLARGDSTVSLGRRAVDLPHIWMAVIKFVQTSRLLSVGSRSNACRQVVIEEWMIFVAPLRLGTYQVATKPQMQMRRRIFYDEQENERVPWILDSSSVSGEPGARPDGN
ncbi:hypothetical protein CRV24_009817 [Beauveria bassiana]|nr:hypothetical protein CRV24_009817 [Beauveria bassiana]